jgi:hypothetical protein
VEERVRRILGIVLLGFTGLLLPALPAHAAGGTTHQHAIDWGQHDTAVYVVSTLNVLHTRRGQSVAALMARRLHVAHYEVWDDLSLSDLYFILLKRDDGSLAGALAYQMGWPQPLGLSTNLGRMGVHSAPTIAVTAYRTDPKQLIGSFTSTLPQ